MRTVTRYDVALALHRADRNVPTGGKAVAPPPERFPAWVGAADMVGASGLGEDDLWKREPLCVSCFQHRAGNGSCGCVGTD